MTDNKLKLFLKKNQTVKYETLNSHTSHASLEKHRQKRDLKF